MQGNLLPSLRHCLNNKHSVFYSSHSFKIASTNAHRNSWIIDTGATDHMVGSIPFLTTITATVSSHVNLPNGQKALVTHISTVQISATLVLTNVLCVPSFTFNLLSVSKLLASHSCCLIFLHQHCFIQNLVSWGTIGVGEERDGLFYLLQNDPSVHVPFVFSALSINNVSDDIWHYLLGHLSSSRLALLHKYVPTISVNPEHICTVCPLSKQKRLPFSDSHSVSHFIFELIHCDIWGLFSVKSTNGSQYFLTIVDDHSRYTWVFLMHHKSQTRFILQSFFIFVETQFKTHIKCLRTDNGIEFLMPDFYASKGVIHQRSCVETPQQNAVVERKHQHLLNVARSLRFQANLPLFFWGDCVLTATHLINRNPTPLLSNKSHFEVLFHKLPAYNHLRVFGCLCYASTLLQSRTKFDSRATPCIMIGYPSSVKGYTLFNLHTKSVFISRNVIFHEHVFPFASNFLNPTTDGCFVIPNSIPDVNLPNFVPATIPDPVSIPQPSANLRRSSRLRNPPSYLQDFHCQLANSSPHFHSPSSADSAVSSGTPYPISSYLSYNKLSKAHNSFSLSVSSVFEPQFFHQAVKYPHWREAMQAEISALKENQTWTLVDLPPNKTPIGCKWVYKVKFNSNGQLERYKARLVAKGYSQSEGIDYLETFSPMAKLTTVRLLLALAAAKCWHPHQLDVNNAFFHGTLNEEVYMKLPPGFSFQGESEVCKLSKSLYGLKQASRQWFSRFSSTLITHGFAQSKANYSLFTRLQGSSFVALLVYVDDIVIASNDMDAISSLTAFLNSQFVSKT
jgi:hypothetical protein